MKTVDADLNINSVGASPCNTQKYSTESKGWFLHPSDALLLGSYITQEDICQYQGSGPDMLSSSYNPKLAILDRRVDRKVINIEELAEKEFVVSKETQRTSRFSYFTLDDKSLIHQARLMRRVDILLAVKGSGETNIAWMRPCSIVMEVSPWGYYVPHYFQKLSRRVGLLHYSWQVQLKDTKTKELFRNRPECARKFHEISISGMNNATHVNKMCFNDQLCRSCAMAVDGKKND